MTGPDLVAAASPPCPVLWTTSRLADVRAREKRFGLGGAASPGKATKSIFFPIWSRGSAFPLSCNGPIQPVISDLRHPIVAPPRVGLRPSDAARPPLPGVSSVSRRCGGLVATSSARQLRSVPLFPVRSSQAPGWRRLLLLRPRPPSRLIALRLRSGGVYVST